MWHGSTLEALSNLLGSPSRWFSKFFYVFFNPFSTPSGPGLGFGVKSFEDPFGPLIHLMWQPNIYFYCSLNGVFFFPLVRVKSNIERLWRTLTIPY